ncbi:MAG: extracellular solute-binding protein [Anaerolineae bacterium]|nr:extracellular solute-binding protein [Anaerolineae bacterium]
MMHRVFRLALLILVVALAACDSGDGPSTVDTDNGGNIQRPNNAIDVSIIYAPESELYMPKAIDDFNQAYAQGRNPVTGQNLASGERPVYVTGQPGSSGTVMQGIVNAIIAPNNANVYQPVIFQPSVSHWLALANFQSGRQLFDLADSRATALAPVVMAIWESRLEAIRNTVGHEDIGWEELLGVLNSPNGWQDYGFSGRKTVYYGHTDPYISSTALSTLIAEFYAAARENGFTGRRLTLDQVNDTDVQDGVRQIEQLIRHYSSRTTEFKEYIAQGPDYLDFVALEENDLIFINLGKTDVQPPEQLVALYPKEGTFWHEHPMGIVNASWVTDEQKEGARAFVDYILTPDVQLAIMEQGFRPANPDVELAFPFAPENGVTLEGPPNVLDVPAPDVISAIQQSWSFVKKQADVLLLIDVSGSMEGDKLEQAKQAAVAFIEEMEPTNRLGLALFSDRVEVRYPLENVETVRQQILGNVRGLRAGGGTALNAAVQEAVNLVNEESDRERIRAVVILSDGADTSDGSVTLNEALQAISASRESLNPVIVIPVAYGADADINALSSIARASSTRVSSGDPQNILGVLEIISSYF